MADAAMLAAEAVAPADSGRVGALERLYLESVRLKELLEERLVFERLLSEISSLFTNLPASDVDRTIIYGLQRISEFLGADRCNLVQFVGSKEPIRAYHSWIRTGTPPLPDFSRPLAEMFPWAAARFRHAQEFQFYSLDDLPAEAEIDRRNFAGLGTKSHLSVPLTVGGSVAGALSIATVTTHRAWPTELVQRLRLVGEIFANALVRKQKELEIRDAFLEIKKLKDQLETDYTYLRDEIGEEHDIQNLIGQSAGLRTVLSKIHQIGPLNSTVLIQGETGTGKELVARGIHAASPRRDRPMVKICCAALSSNLIESELFGHEKGAFTSAMGRHMGRFEVANGSSLFLDEIGELPLESQAKLLRVLQEGEFERLGSSRTIKVDVRIITATNRNLEEEVRKGRFRRDLWYRLNVFPITLPPLRHRPEDIPLLATWFINRFGRRMGKTITRIPSQVMTLLQGYHWPGNVRELEHVIERAVINSRRDSLELLDDLSGFQGEAVRSAPPLTLQEVERNHILSVLERCRGRISGPNGAAVLLGINASTLRSRMEKLGILTPSGDWSERYLGRMGAESGFQSLGRA